MNDSALLRVPSIAIRIDTRLRHVLAPLRDRGDGNYGREAVTQLEHALQAATFARRDGADPELVTAALLHDVGHLLHELPDDAPDEGIDDRHEHAAVPWLRDFFRPAVVEPIRLHVESKRYLVVTDDQYILQLSRPSLISLELQGGPMSAAEVRAFERSPHAEAAVALRRWDDAAKVPGLETPPLEEFEADVRRALLAALDRGSERLTEARES